MPCFLKELSSPLPSKGWSYHTFHTHSHYLQYSISSGHKFLSGNSLSLQLFLAAATCSMSTSLMRESVLEALCYSLFSFSLPCSHSYVLILLMGTCRNKSRQVSHTSGAIQALSEKGFPAGYLPDNGLNFTPVIQSISLN